MLRKPLRGWVVEPIPFLLPQHKNTPVKAFMQEARTDKGLYVIAYSAQGEKALNEEFGVLPGIHYDQYVPKRVPGSIAFVKATLDALAAARKALHF